MKSIVLPAGTEHVQFGELAHLIADALWPDAGPDDDSMTNAFARINLDAELARAVDSGALPVKDPLTLGPHTYPVGYALKTALVTVDDLQRFVSDRGLSVIVETPEPQAADAPAAKGEAVPVRSPSGDDDTPRDATGKVYWRAVLFSNIKKIDEHKKTSVRGIIKYLRGLGDNRLPNKGTHDELYWIDDMGNTQNVQKKAVSNAASDARKLPSLRPYSP